MFLSMKLYLILLCVQIFTEIYGIKFKYSHITIMEVHSVSLKENDKL